MRERFRREARTAARLSHPHIVPLHTFGEVSGLVYFVVGYIAGESLASRLKREGPFPPEEAEEVWLTQRLRDQESLTIRLGVAGGERRETAVEEDEAGEPSGRCG